MVKTKTMPKACVRGERKRLPIRNKTPATTTDEEMKKEHEPVKNHGTTDTDDAKPKADDSDDTIDLTSTQPTKKPRHDKKSEEEEDNDDDDGNNEENEESDHESEHGNENNDDDNDEGDDDDNEEEHGNEEENGNIYAYYYDNYVGLNRGEYGVNDYAIPGHLLSEETQLQRQWNEEAQAQKLEDVEREHGTDPAFKDFMVWAVCDRPSFIFDALRNGFDRNHNDYDPTLADTFFNAMNTGSRQL